jgi:hypothetical protein
LQSLELTVDPTYAKQLVQITDLDPSVLVVGPELSGHLFSEGRQTLNGRTCPWNTFAGNAFYELKLIFDEVVSAQFGN